MVWTKKCLYFSCTFVAVVVLISCGVSYSFTGAGSIDYTKVKTISIADFPITADLVYIPLATVFNQELKDLFMRQTRLQLVNPNQNADLQIEGEITGYNAYNEAISGGEGFATKTRLTITVNVRYINNTNHAEDFEQKFSAFRTYDSALGLNAVQDTYIAEMVQEINDQIFNATVANW